MKRTGQYIDSNTKFPLTPLFQRGAKETDAESPLYPPLKKGGRGDLEEGKEPAIVYLLSQFPETHETFILREIMALQEQGVCLKILSLKPCRDTVIHPEAEKLMAGTVYGRVGIFHALAYISRHPLKAADALRYLLKTYWKNPREFIKGLYVLAECFYFARALKRDAVRHIHSHWATMPTTAAMILSRLIGVPFSFTAHAWDIFVNSDGLAEKIKRARFAVTCTEYNRKYLAGLNGNGRIYRNYHGLDLREFDVASVFSPSFRRCQNDKNTVIASLDSEGGGAKQSLLPSEIASSLTSFTPRNDEEGRAYCGNGEGLRQSLMILSVGRLVETKGFPYLIKACGMLRKRGVEFSCDIVGQGPLKNSLRAQAACYNLENRVRFLGVQSQEEIKRLYARAALFVLPCVVSGNGDRDGIPNVLLEAMAMGLPVIATDVSGIPEAVKDRETGLLVPPKDSLALAGAITELYSNGELRAKITANARALMERQFDVQKNIGELMGIYMDNGVLTRRYEESAY